MPSTAAPSTKVLYVRINSDLHRQLRVLAAEAGRPVSELVTDALTAYVARKEKGRG